MIDKDEKRTGEIEEGEKSGKTKTNLLGNQPVPLDAGHEDRTPGRTLRANIAGGAPSANRVSGTLITAGVGSAGELRAESKVPSTAVGLHRARRKTSKALLLAGAPSTTDILSTGVTVLQSEEGKSSKKMG